MEGHWPKHCGCGSSYTQDAWAKLPYLARWEIEGGPTHELRHCHCQTTLAIDVSMLDGASLTEEPKHDRLAHLLAEKKVELLDQWSKRVVDDATSEPELRPVMGAFVDDLIATLLDDGADSRRLRQITHHPARAERISGLRPSLRATLREWANFRAALIDLCDGADMVLDAKRMRLVHRAIDEAASRSAAELYEARSA